ncbi:hypothetical protein DOTSEDRAFT_51318 [Dothistroma septosporum NZE10]|uniref:Ams2/SPT21 N-terminal domain-containing protein n=1 Tax=Dothistroma septosporum (strain NZE10 / CBS 128990) TaxID=675120 RepID=N1Q0T4_DOTSN|nr:hypothetical protein DOTSEDRAFT_51318 [Dothistroma septosporum NZE10]
MESGGFGGDDSLGDLPTRPMRVKVLYTFDAENKTTCLARFPETLNIPVVSVDDQSQVGVIDLQQCVQAMLSASPEIMAKLETGDFTVYTFDYTELDTPIVGQGRLSSLLAQPTSNKGKSMITGRVCKNVQAIFTGGVKEILEVKFRLTPLSRPSHNEMMRQSEGFRSVSPATSTGFDPNAWTASQQNKAQQQSNEYFGFDGLTSVGDNGAALLENMFGIGAGSGGEPGELQHLGGVGDSETPTDTAYGLNPAFPAQSHSAPGSRAGSPVIHPGSSSINDSLRHQSFQGYPSHLAEQSRPDSRASVRSETSPSGPQRQASTQSFYAQQTEQSTEVFYNEDGQPRKRAKVMQADWGGKSSFGTKTRDLRVTAATASSMHMHRPIAKRPSVPGTDLEPPPRVPTPVPQRKILPRPSMQPTTSRSLLRQASTIDSDFMSDGDQMSDAMSSPEESSPANSVAADGTPLDIPSSPPLIPGYNMPTPSSPGLPTLPSHVMDSGYMSGTIMESMEDDENRSPDAEDLEMAAKYRARSHQQESFIKIEGVATSDAPLYSMAAAPRSDLNGNEMRRVRNAGIVDLPSGKAQSNQGHQSRPHAPLKRATTLDVRPILPRSDSAAMHSEAPGSRRGSLALPPKSIARATSQEQNSKAPTKQKRQSLQRSRTTYNDSETGSPAPSDTEGRPRGNARSGSAVPRRKIIQDRLDAKIRNGEVPIYCTHCGAIETTTWRKLYTKVLDRAPEKLDGIEGEGETIGIEELEKDKDSGEITKFRIRKCIKNVREQAPGPGFDEVNVCNPCGLWFKKFRDMRPEDRWHRKVVRKSKKSKGNDDNATDGIEPASEAFFTDQVLPEEAIDPGSADDAQAEGADGEARLAPVRRSRAHSMDFGRGSGVAKAGAVRQAAATRREIQSSPVHFGSQRSPIELDLTPGKPTRRQLFPSPRQSGEVRNLDECPDSRPASRSGEEESVEEPAVKVITTEETTVNVYETFAYDKENMIPPLDKNDDLSHLFDGSPSAVFKTSLPKTPSKCTPRSQNLFNNRLKTPTQSSRKRKALTPSQNAANNADMNMNANDFFTSPTSNRYFLRSTPSRLERTPGSRNVSGGSQTRMAGPSPFSRHLAAMLSDANVMGDTAFTSPSRQYDFSDLPTFTTPGREVDWKGLDEILSSEFANFDDGNGVSFHSDAGTGGQV